LLVQVSKVGEEKVIEIITKLAKGNIICIVGPSSSGKSYFAKRIAETLRGTVISTDSFYRADSWKLSAVLGTFDHPHLLDWDLLISTLYEALEKEEVEVPVYDMSISARKGYKKVKVRKPLIVEGIFASYGPLRSMCDFRVSFDSPLHLLLARRMLRDVERAMEAPSRILDRVVRTVFPMAKLFVEPQVNDVNVKIYNDWRPELPNSLDRCSSSQRDVKGVPGERRVIELTYDKDSVYVIENFYEELVEHFVLVSWEGRYIGTKVHPETAYATLSALSAHGYKLKAYYQKGYWKNEVLHGKVLKEVTWKTLEYGSCCKLCVP